MQNSNLVTTEAFDGLIREVACEIGVSDKRIYEILGRDNPYVKIWRLLNALGRLAPERLELVRADFNARCDRLTRGRSRPVTDAELHKETSDAVNSVLQPFTSRQERRREITEAISVLQKKLEDLDRGDAAAQRTIERFAS